VKPSGQTVVFAPTGESIPAVQSRVMRKCAWLFRQLDRIDNGPTLTPMRHFVSGETHLVLGKPYRLSIEPHDTSSVRVQGDRIYISTPHVEDQAECRRLLMEFYGEIARGIFPDRLRAMVPPFNRKGLKPPPLIIRRMTKRWGS